MQAIIYTGIQKNKRNDSFLANAVVSWRSERDLNPRAAFDGLLPEQGSPFGLVGITPNQTLFSSYFGILAYDG